MSPNDDEVDLTVLEEWLRDSYASSVRTAYLILGNRSDAEDAVQDAFLRAWRFRDAITTRSGMKPWLYRVVVNSCYSRLRKEIPHRDLRAPDAELATLSDYDDPASRVASTFDMTRALRDLAPNLRVVVVLRYYADLSERDIATAIGRPAGTVKSRLSEARRQLARHAALQPALSEFVPSTSKEQR
ncbi:MAG TPA: RNA polymerase sigma factor [Acidimicrobiales bacterium]|nr:RNA polymerase sigma factor [Acidimicrobiales bacterium]